MPEAVAEQAERELRRLERQGEQSPESSMIRSYLDWLLAVPWSKRSEERLDPEHTREVLDEDHAGLEDVKRRITEFIAVRKLRQERGVQRGEPRQRRHPHPGGPAGHRQDLDRRVGGPLAGARVRAPLAGRNPRRGRDPRPPPHLHRRPAGADRPRTARRRDDEPGDPARRGRQGRGRLARRSLRRPARGSRPGPEPLLPRPLPRRRGRSIRGRLPGHRQHHRHDPGTAAGPHGGDRLRRLHDRGEAGDRPRLSVAAPAGAQRTARRGGRDLRRAAAQGGYRVHPRGRGAPARARAGQAAAQRRDADRLRRGQAPIVHRPRRGNRRPRPPALLPGVGGAHRDPRRGHRAWRSPGPAATCCSSRRRRWTATRAWC